MKIALSTALNELAASQKRFIELFQHGVEHRFINFTDDFATWVIFCLRGVPIRAFLDQVAIETEKPKDLSAYYFVFRATDGYCNVYSWNELYDTGNRVFILTTDGTHELAAMPERILVLCTADIQSGRRLLKGLTSIEIKKAE